MVEDPGPRSFGDLPVGVRQHKAEASHGLLRRTSAICWVRPLIGMSGRFVRGWTGSRTRCGRDTVSITEPRPVFQICPPLVHSTDAEGWLEEVASRQDCQD